ncbi:hypothetical protein J8J27_31285, partial [Mycobacterium tuberculosis]|nr:hypothetical protein [Mycobacterium tuberculosis]
LEAEADRVRAEIERTSDAVEYGLKTYLANGFGIRWRSAPLPGDAIDRFDAERGELLVSDIVPSETALFAADRHLGLAAAGHVID